MTEAKLPIVAIIGLSNTGKSSLFNALIGRREAIVADEPGTTRDRVMTQLDYEGKRFWLADTAGLKDPADDFELSIQDQIREVSAAASVIVMVTEADRDVTDDERRLATEALKSKKPVILVVNKIDKNQRADMKAWLKLGIRPIVGLSATHKRGLEDLLTILGDYLPKAKPDNTDNKLRLALLGRPNVGKSALFNRLSGSDEALVSSVAGTTRDVNRASLEHDGRTIEVVDTAGIRRPGKIGQGVEHFSVLRTLAAIEEADVAALLVDVSEPAVKLDQKIAGLVKEAGKGLIIVVSKWDLAEEQGLDRETIAERISAEFIFVNWAPLLFTSAVKGQNTEKLLELALEIEQCRQTSFKTTELNRWLESSVAEHPPAGLHGQQPKLHYMVWEEGNLPPSFKIFGAKTKFLHWSYKRYLEHSFRDKWPLVGTPLKFWFIDSRKRLE